MLVGCFLAAPRVLKASSRPRRGWRSNWTSPSVEATCTAATCGCPSGAGRTTPRQEVTRRRRGTPSAASRRIRRTSTRSGTTLGNCWAAILSRRTFRRSARRRQRLKWEARRRPGWQTLPPCRLSRSPTRCTRPRSILVWRVTPHSKCRGEAQEAPQLPERHLPVQRAVRVTLPVKRRKRNVPLPEPMPTSGSTTRTPSGRLKMPRAT